MPGARSGIERASAVTTLAVSVMTTAVLVLAAQTRGADLGCANTPPPAHQLHAC